MASGYTMTPVRTDKPTVKSYSKVIKTTKFAEGGYVKSQQELMDDSLAKSNINFQQSKLLKKALKEQKGK